MVQILLVFNTIQDKKTNIKKNMNTIGTTGKENNQENGILTVTCMEKEKEKEFSFYI